MANVLPPFPEAANEIKPVGQDSVEPRYPAGRSGSAGGDHNRRWQASAVV